MSRAGPLPDDLSFAQTIRKALRLDRAWRLVWRSAPAWTLVNLCLVVAQGLLPLATLYLIKRVMDTVAAAVAGGSSTLSAMLAYRQVLLWVLLAGLVALLMALCRSLGELASEAQSFAITDAMSDLLHAQSVAIDLAYYEESSYYDTLHRAQQDAPFRVTRIVNGLVLVAQNGLALLAVTGLLFSFSPLMGLILLVVALPGAVVRLVHSRNLYRLERQETETERRAWYYHWMLTDSGHAKEVRLFDLGALFRQRFRALRKGLREHRLHLVRRRALSDFLVQALAAVAVFGSLAFGAWRALLGAITLGSLTIYYLALHNGLGYLQAILRGLAGLYEDNLFLNDFYQFLALSPRVRTPARPRPLPAAIQQGIAFHGVSFTYPDSAQPAVQGIDLLLAPGEVIALVGENGSGKTTLVKLLCRLYDPAAGQITLDGADLADFDPVRWRREISVVFQDYVHYYLSAAENIWLGNVDQALDREAIARIAGLSGADAVIHRLPQGYDTILGHWFEEGHELSIGEWQKVALARAFWRDAPIIVLDEPTSALDPLAEADLFRRFRQLIQGRSAILISHRFSTVQMADRIYVLHNGRVTEQGTHQDLLLHNGRYARLYRAQAERYHLH